MRSEVVRRHGVSTGVVEHLLERYGALAGPVLSLIDDDPELGRPLAGAPEYLAAEVVYAVTAEAALSLDDVLARRLRVAIETTHRGAGSATHAARLIGPVLGWDEATRRRRVEEFVARIDGERRSQKMPDDEAAAAALTDPPWPVSPG